MFDATPKLCTADQSVVRSALMSLMEDYSERIKRNARWADEGKAISQSAGSAEAMRRVFASDYMSAVRAAGMC
jgi:hypothetical protein